MTPQGIKYTQEKAYKLADDVGITITENGEIQIRITDGRNVSMCLYTRSDVRMKIKDFL